MGARAAPRVDLVGLCGRRHGHCQRGRSLLEEEAEDAGWYVLLFGPEKVTRDDLIIVEQPYAEVARSLGPPDDRGESEGTDGDPSSGTEQPLAPWLLLGAVGLLVSELWLRQIRRR